MIIYTISQVIDDRRTTRLCVAADRLDKEHVAMAVGFDPYDVFADYEITGQEEVSDNLLFDYGLKVSEVIIDKEQAEEVYHAQFKPTWDVSKQLG